MNFLILGTKVEVAKESVVEPGNKEDALLELEGKLVEEMVEQSTRMVAVTMVGKPMGGEVK